MNFSIGVFTVATMDRDPGLKKSMHFFSPSYLSEAHPGHGPEGGPGADLEVTALLQEGHVEVLEGEEHHGDEGPGPEEEEGGEELRDGTEIYEKSRRNFRHSVRWTKHT